MKKMTSMKMRKKTSRYELSAINSLFDQKTAADFAKQLNQLQSKNDKRKEVVEKMEKDVKGKVQPVSKPSPGVGSGSNSYKVGPAIAALKKPDPEEDEGDADEFDKEFDAIVKQQNQARARGNKSVPANVVQNN